jgi:hypothetical protein
VREHGVGASPGGEGVVRVLPTIVWLTPNGVLTARQVALEKMGVARGPRDKMVKVSCKGKASMSLSLDDGKFAVLLRECSRES